MFEFYSLLGRFIKSHDARYYWNAQRQHAVTNTGRKTKRKMRTPNRKAMSPVVASIILIAVTVAISLSVAAWAGALTFNYMGSSSVTITKVTFVGTSGQELNSLNLTLTNTGTNRVTVDQIKVNSIGKAFSGNTTLSAGTAGAIVTVSNVSWSTGNSYRIELFDTSGQAVGSTQQDAT